MFSLSDKFDDLMHNSLGRYNYCLIYKMDLTFAFAIT